MNKFDSISDKPPRYLERLGGRPGRRAPQRRADGSLPQRRQHQFQPFGAEASPTCVIATVYAKAPGNCPIIRIDTNQGVYGLGEVRDAGQSHLRSDAEEPASR
jgi:hypothetical protein